MRNRWVVLAAGCLIQTVLGGIYAWSTFVPYLRKDYGLSIGQCGLTFGVTVLTFTSAMIFAGRLLVKKGPRFVASISAGLFAAGYLLASMSSGSFALLLISLGVVTGCGIGFGYVCPLSVGIKWFPNKKGLVTGVAVAGFGVGAILLASVAEFFLIRGVDVLMFFRWFGVGAGMVLFLSAAMLSEPPSSAPPEQKENDKSAVFSKPFLVNLIGLFAGTFAGLLIIGNLTPIVIKAGLSEQQAAVAVSIFALGNGVGRIAWGKFFDHWHYKCLPLSLAGTAVSAALLLMPAANGLMMVSVFSLGFCFGSNFVVYASAITRYFGANAFPRLYPICFVAYGIAGVVGPGMGGFMADATGTFVTSIYICIALVSVTGVWALHKLPVFNQQHDGQERKMWDTADRFGCRCNG